MRSRDDASKSAMRRMLATFFDDSTERAVAALLEVSHTKLDKDELGRIAKVIENARKEGR